MSRIGCKHCNWKGYTKHSFWSGEKDEILVSVCSECKDKRGYNIYVKQKYGKGDNLHLLPGQEPEAVVIDFESYKQKQELKYYGKEETRELAEEQFRAFGEIPRRN